jgi:hypothetical protein
MLIKKPNVKMQKSLKSRTGSAVTPRELQQFRKEFYGSALTPQEEKSFKKWIKGRK